jgi:GTPase
MKFVVRLVIAFCLLLPSIAGAQQTAVADSWRAVSSRSATETLKVRLKNGGMVKGKFKSASDAGLVLELKGKEVSLSRDEIASVAVLGKRSAGKSALIGMAVGGGVGAGAGAGFGASQNSNFFLTRGESVAIGAAVFGAIGVAAGGVIGFATGHAGHRETMIYQALPAR